MKLFSAIKALVEDGNSRPLAELFGMRVIKTEEDRKYYDATQAISSMLHKKAEGELDHLSYNHLCDLREVIMPKVQEWKKREYKMYFESTQYEQALDILKIAMKRAYIIERATADVCARQTCQNVVDHFNKALMAQYPTYKAELYKRTFFDGKSPAKYT